MKRGFNTLVKSHHISREEINKISMQFCSTSRWIRSGNQFSSHAPGSYEPQCQMESSCICLREKRSLQLEIVFIVSRPCVHKCKHFSPGTGQQDILSFKGSSQRITTTDELSPPGLQKILSPNWFVSIKDHL